MFIKPLIMLINQLNVYKTSNYHENTNFNFFVKFLYKNSYKRQKSLSPVFSILLIQLDNAHSGL